MPVYQRFRSVRQGATEIDFVVLSAVAIISCCNNIWSNHHLARALFAVEC